MGHRSRKRIGAKCTPQSLARVAREHPQAWN
jgi:hypothetical protein